MAQNLVMKQLDERQMEQEVSLLAWSPKMDILAMALVNGSVALYRLQWQRVWLASPSCEGSSCTSLAWRPDGKLLASGDSNGLLTVRHIENSNPIHTEQLDSRITSCNWMTCPVKEANNQQTNKENIWEFLAKLPSLTKTYSSGGEELEDCRKLDSDSREMSILLAGTQSGSVYLLVNGYLLVMRLTLGDLLGDSDPGSVDSLVMSTDMKSLSVVLGGRLLVLKCPLLATCQTELGVLADKYSLIHGILSYTGETIKQIREAWETILLEMDTKLASYAENNPPGTVAADFLELLMFGVTSPQLEHFLHKDMTEKGLKKLGHSIELSYSNIQRLVLKYLGSVSQSLNFHLGELLGLARVGHRYSVLGITENVVEKALFQAMSFWSKGVELQQVIDESMKNFKAFFRWVYVEILRLGEEKVSGDLSKVSQQDITFIAEFLKRFQSCHQGSTGIVSHVYLERVGQYLADADLVQPPDNSTNPWHKLLAEHPELQEIPFIIPVNTKTSIVQEHNRLTTAVQEIFCPSLGDHLAHQTTVVTSLLLDSQSPSSCSQLVDQTMIHGLVTTQSGKLLVWNTDSVTSRMSWLGIGDRKVVDTSFYTKEYLSILVEEEGGSQRLIQVPLQSLSSHLTEGTPDAVSGPMVEEVLGVRSREIEGLAARQFAVSGPRKVSVFLFKNRKRLRIYDMEGEEEEDETLESSGFNLSEEFNTSQ